MTPSCRWPITTLTLLSVDEILLQTDFSCSSAGARNNGRSTDNVWTDWEVDLSTFRLAGHVQVTFHRIENEMN